jgi:hypothetical protein
MARKPRIHYPGTDYGLLGSDQANSLIYEPLAKRAK